MKRLVITHSVWFMLLCAQAAYIPVTSVEVSPVQPVEGQDITLYVAGEAGSPPASFYAQSTVSASLVVLDIHFTDFGTATVITPWDHAQNIGPLQAGVYALTVNTYDYRELNGLPADTYNTGFTVIPEPSAAGMIVAGGLLIYCRRLHAGCNES